MLDLLNDETNETQTDSAATKRERVETELRTNSARSDREIARVVGCDGKTVAAARQRLGIAAAPSPPDTPTTRRNMLIAGCKDFDAKYPSASGETAEEAVDNAIAKGVVSLAPEHEEEEENHFLPESDALVLSSQPATAVYINRYHQIVIRQEADWNDDGDHFVYICPQHLGALIKRLQSYLPGGFNA